MVDGPEDVVGYGRPPKVRRFGEPGGNPRGKGRAKGARNVSTVMEEVLSALITVKDGPNRQRKISKLDASLTQLANKAATGDLRAIQMVIALWQGIEARKESDEAPQMQLTDADRQVLDLLATRARHHLEDGSDE
jgi:hypothetical protein